MNDFYYIEPKRWKKLGYFPTKDLNEIKKFVLKGKINVSRTFLFKKNLGQWFKYIFKK